MELGEKLLQKKLLAAVLLGIMLIILTFLPPFPDITGKQVTKSGTKEVLDNIPVAIGDYIVPQPVPININYTLGCFYMPKPSYPSHQWSDLKRHNSNNRIKELKGQRMPLLGYYQGDNSVVLDWQIKYAVDRGITFFVFDDFWTEGHDGPLYNSSISAFFKAQYQNYMQFAIMPTQLSTRFGSWTAQRDFFLNTVLPYYVENYFNKSNYLLVEGKPLVNIFNHWSVFGDATSSQINSILDTADSYIASKTNFTGAYWVTNNLRSSTVDFSQVKSCGFDAVMPYYIAPYLYPDGGWDNFPIDIEEKDPNYNWSLGIPYSTMKNESINLHSQSFSAAIEDGIKFISAISVDFDSRAYWWQDYHLYFSGQNNVDYWNLLATVKSMVDNNPSAVPICTNTGKKIVGLGPWNEQMEATSIEPGYSCFQQGDNHDPFFHVDAAAKVFGGPETYEHLIPDDYSRGFSPKDIWAFNSTTKAGKEFWQDWSITSSFNIVEEDLCELIIDKNRCVMSTTTYVPTSNYSNFKIQLNLISGGPIDKLHLRWMSTNYSESADQFNSTLEPGGKVYDGITEISGSVYEIVDGFREYTFELDQITAYWRGRLFYLELLIYPDPEDLPMKIHINKLWLNPPQVDNLPPIADSNGPYIGCVDQVVTFDGTSSYDPDGVIVNYTWYFGDGDKGYGSNPTHIYSQTGKYNVNLTVKDEYGINDTDTTTSDISGENQPPSKVTGLTVQDKKDGKLKLNWDQATDNILVDHYEIWRDDVFLINTTTNEYLDTGLTNNQEYTYKVRAVDTTGNLGEFSDSKTGKPTKTSTGGGGGAPPAMNTNPVADASKGEPYLGFVGEEIVFDGSKSYDPDDDSITYEWDFGDNTKGSGVTVSHSYSSAGTYTVILTVEDESGAKDTYETKATITKPNIPPSKPTIDGPTKGTIDTEYDFTIQSFDLDNDTIKYTVIWGDETSYFTESDFLPNATEYKANHSWTSPGKFTITVTATDNETISEASTFAIFIDSINIMDIGYLLDIDSDGEFDRFHNESSLIETDLGQKNGMYLIDDDGDGKWDYTYTADEGISDYEEEKKEETPGFELIFVIIGIALVLLYKRRRIKL